MEQDELLDQAVKNRAPVVLTLRDFQAGIEKELGRPKLKCL